MMIVLLAGLQSIPQDLYEAGEVDGASTWQQFWYITLPLLKFTMIVALLIRMIDLTKIFGLIYLLTFGGPAGSTQTVAFSTYLTGFQDFRISYASALSYVIVVGVFILTLIFQRVSRFREGEEA
jgi:multiple sugar transport system permease protein